jgi:diguanylate cyclase (GGDEF)-like protein
MIHGSAAVTGPLLRTLTSAQQAHGLPHEEAERAYPVHLARAIVHYYDSETGLLFVGDSTGSVFVDMRGQKPLRMAPGDIVTVDGVSSGGDVAPIISRPHVLVIGKGTLPPAPLVEFGRISDREYDGQWVMLEGIVRSIIKPNQTIAYRGFAGTSHMSMIIRLASANDQIDVIVPNPEGKNYAYLIDAKVRIKGSCGPRYNRRGQVLGAHLMAPNMSGLQVIEWPLADPFSLPLSEISGVMRYATSALGPGHRLRVRGVVTATLGSGLFSIMDSKHGIFVYTDGGGAPLNAGDLLDVVGFPAIGDASAILEDAVYRRTGSGRAPPPTVVSISEGINGDHDAESVQLSGQLLYTSRTPAGQMMLLTDGKATFTAILSNQDAGELPTIQNGSQLLITGICFVETDAYRMPKTLRVLLQSPKSVRVLSGPPWWGDSRIRQILGVSGVVAVAVFVWVIMLRKQVKRQTEIIRRNEARLHHLSHHDSLTDLPNRLLMSERLEFGLKRVTQTQAGLGVLMIDVDNFKQVNDTLGHSVGDQLLCAVAIRVAAAVRKTDVLARIGGDEFVILLPGVQETREAESIATKIVSSFSEPVRFCEFAQSISVSVGVTTFPGGGRTSSALLQSADVAMYHAKTHGRNKYAVYSTDMKVHGSSIKAPAEHPLVESGQPNLVMQAGC